DRSRVGWPSLDDRLIVKPEALQLVTFVAQIADFQDQIPRELALNIGHPLTDIRRSRSLNVSQNLRSHQASSAPSGATGAGALKCPRVAKIGRPLFVAGDVNVAASLVASHIEGRVGGVLHVEYADAGSNGPASGGSVGQAEAR